MFQFISFCNAPTSAVGEKMLLPSPGQTFLHNADGQGHRYNVEVSGWIGPHIFLCKFCDLMLILIIKGVLGIPNVKLLLALW